MYRTKKSCWRFDVCPCIPTRYVLAVVASFGFLIMFGLRVNMSMAMVVMANSSANANDSLQYNWTSQQQGFVLSAFYLGYTLTQIPGGYLAGRFGSRYLFGIGVLMTSVLTLLTQLAAEIHIGALIALRVLEGCFEGVTFPAMHSALGKWSPTKERTILASITYAGPAIGIMLSSPLSAFLCEYGFAGGWPSVFYVHGSAGIVWFVFWLYFGFSSPASHPRISQAERLYIESSIETDELIHDKDEKTPWFNILTSPAVWAITVCFFCFGWSNFTLITCTPTYFKDVLQLSLGKSLMENGLFSALPHIGFFVVELIGGPLADLLRNKWLRTVTVRKIFTSICLLVPAAGLISVGYLGSSKLTCVSFMVLISAFGGFMNQGFMVNHVDIAPQYAGVLMGITNMVGTIPGFVGPLVAETIAHKPSSGENETSAYQAEWREVFIIAAEVNIFGAIVYLILARGERQWWAGGGQTVEGPTSDNRKQQQQKQQHWYTHTNLDTDTNNGETEKLLTLNSSVTKQSIN